MRRDHWLNARLRELGKTQGDLAARLNLTTSRISEIVGGRREVKARELRPMAEFLKWPEATLLAHLSGGAVEPVSLRPVQVIGAVQAGVWVEAVEWPEEQRYPAPVAADSRFHPMPQFGLEVRGPSMNEVYPAGTIVVCVRLLDLGRDPNVGERVVVQRRSDLGFEATVKELRRDRDGKWWLWPRSTDPNFQQPWPLPTPDGDDQNDDVRILALVIGSYRPEA